MNRLLSFLPLALAACASHPAPLPPPFDAAHASQAEALAPHEVRSVVQQDSLQGRWTITQVNGRKVSGLWLDLGGEGSGAVAKRPDGGMNMESPQPQTSAFLGCNDLRLSGWSRNGDKLFVGSAWSTMTERGCSPAIMATEDQTQFILRVPMTMELTSPDRLRLVNEAGTLDLVRQRS
jgi:heat shock protein HslJ